MKRSFGKYILVGGLALTAVAANAQTADAQQDGKAKQGAEAPSKKGQKGKDVQQIIITRSSTADDKAVIEINGDRVTVNGKDLKDLKDADIDINISRVKDVNALVVSPRSPRTPMALNAPRVYNFGYDNDGMRFFSEDSSRAMLGVVTAEDDKGARINEISKESAAEKAGLKKGDIITRIDDAKIEETGDVTRQVRKRKPGDKVTVTYLRDGKEQKVVAELTRWKGLQLNSNNFRVMVPSRVTPFEQNEHFDFRNMEINVARGDRPRLGVSVQDSEDGKGVVVQDVEEESNAAKAGIKKGDVITRFNDTEINDVTVLRREMAANRDKISAKVRLLRNGKEQTVEVRMPRKLKSADL